MRLNLTRPMEKPVDINGITSAPCIAPHITYIAAVLDYIAADFQILCSFLVVSWY